MTCVGGIKDLRGTCHGTEDGWPLSWQWRMPPLHRRPPCAGGAGGQALEDAHERLFVAFRMQRKRALAAAVARLEVALQEDAALAELEALESAGEEVPPPPPSTPALHCRCTHAQGGAVAPMHKAALEELEALEGAGDEVSPPASASLHPCTRLFAGMPGPVTGGHVTL